MKLVSIQVNYITLLFEAFIIASRKWLLVCIYPRAHHSTATFVKLNKQVRTGPGKNLFSFGTNPHLDPDIEFFNIAR